jgi:hypothetical protein
LKKKINNNKKYKFILFLFSIAQAEKYLWSQEKDLANLIILFIIFPLIFKLIKEHL